MQQYAVAFNNRRWVRVIIGALRAALSHCNESVRLRPDANTLDSRGLVHLKLSDYAAAISAYSAALKEYPKNSHSLYGRGLARRLLGDGDAAKIDITSATSADPGVVEKYRSYGVPISP